MMDLLFTEKAPDGAFSFPSPEKLLSQLRKTDIWREQKQLFGTAFDRIFLPAGFPEQQIPGHFRENVQFYRGTVSGILYCSVEENGQPFWIGQFSAEASLCEIRSNIDNMTGEECATLIRLAMENGARDAWLTPIQMKKGRPAIAITILTDLNRATHWSQWLLRHSRTLGIRFEAVHRLELHRRMNPDKPDEKIWYNLKGERRLKKEHSFFNSDAERFRELIDRGEND